MSGESAHALVFGASGLAGWAVADQILKNHPKQGTFSKVTALVNRPLKIAEAFWNLSPTSPKLSLVSDINLTKGSIETFTALLKKNVVDISEVTHVFYFAYKQEMESDTEVQVNCEMLERAIGALDDLCPNLKFFVSIAGSKAYGIDIPREEVSASEELKKFKPPFEEDMGRLPSPYSERIWYYRFQDILKEKSNGKMWTWAEVRPDAIIGFTPNGSVFSLATHWSTYLSLYARLHSTSTANSSQPPMVHFPGTESAYNSLFNPATSSTIAKFSIFAALHPEKCGNGRIFNIADQTIPSTMVELWPKICAYFGLKGVGPKDSPPAIGDTDTGIENFTHKDTSSTEEEDDDRLLPSKYIEKYSHVLEKEGVKKNIAFQGGFLDSYGFYLHFDRHFKLNEARRVGFKEEVDPIEGWIWTFDMFKKAGMML